MLTVCVTRYAKLGPCVREVCHTVKPGFALASVTSEAHGVFISADRVNRDRWLLYHICLYFSYGKRTKWCHTYSQTAVAACTTSSEFVCPKLTLATSLTSFPSKLSMKTQPS